MPAVPTVAVDPKKEARRRRKEIKRAKARVARQAEKAAAKKQETEAMAQAERAKLSIRNEEKRDEWAAYLADQRLIDEIKVEARKGRQHGRDGNILEIAEEKAKDANVETLVFRNVANDPIEWLHSRKSLKQRQYEAALWIRRDVEASQISSVQASDYSKPLVQGGGAAGNVSDRKLDAQRRVDLCMEKLGAVGAKLVRKVVVNCEPLKEVGESLGMDAHYRAKRLAEALDVVADFYRL